MTLQVKDIGVIIGSKQGERSLYIIDPNGDEIKIASRPIPLDYSF